MAVAFGTIGTVASGTTSLAVPYPASISAGDLLVLCIANKFPTNGPSTPADWTLPTNGQKDGGAGTDIGSEGHVYATVFFKIATGSETGNLTVTLTSADSSHGIMLRYTNATGLWSIAANGGGDNTAGNNAWSVTAAADPGIAGGDVVVVASGVNNNSITFTSEALSAAGITFGTMTEREDSSTGMGTDLGLVVSEHPVTSGTSSAPPVFTMTASSSSAVMPAGASVMLRLREDAGGNFRAAAYYYYQQMQMQN